MKYSHITNLSINPFHLVSFFPQSPTHKKKNTSNHSIQNKKCSDRDSNTGYHGHNVEY